MWKKRTFEYDGIKYYDFKDGRGTLKNTLVRVPYRGKLNKYIVWDRNGKTVSVQYFDTLDKAKRFVERLK